MWCVLFEQCYFLTGEYETLRSILDRLAHFQFLTFSWFWELLFLSVFVVAVWMLWVGGEEE